MLCRKQILLDLCDWKFQPHIMQLFNRSYLTAPWKMIVRIRTKGYAKETVVILLYFVIYWTHWIGPKICNSTVQYDANYLLINLCTSCIFWWIYIVEKYIYTQNFITVSNKWFPEIPAQSSHSGLTSGPACKTILSSRITSTRESGAGNRKSRSGALPNRS
jgi:hypothetical protein